MPKASVKLPKFLVDSNGKIYESVPPKVRAVPVEKETSKKVSKREREDNEEAVTEVKRAKGKRVLNTPKDEIEEKWASIQTLPEKEAQKLKKDLIRECNQKKAWIRVFEALPQPVVDDADKKLTSAAALVARLRGLQKTQPQNTVMMEGMKTQAELLFNDAQTLISKFSAKQHAEFEKRQARNLEAKSVFDLKTKKDAKPPKSSETSSVVETEMGEQKHDDGNEHLDAEATLAANEENDIVPAMLERVSENPVVSSPHNISFNEETAME